jgi:hypothetical protein
MNTNLTDEQIFLLHKIAMEARTQSKDELVDALLSCWEGRFRQKQVFLAASKDAGYVFKFNEGTPCLPIECDDVEEFLLEEDTEFVQDMIDEANFVLDMEEIVMTKDE